MRGIPVTDREMERIRAFRKNSLSNREIAYALGRAVSTISRITRVDRTPAEKIRDRREKIRELAEPMLAKGLTRKVIAGRLGVSQDVLRRACPETGRGRDLTLVFHLKMSPELTARLSRAASKFGSTQQQFMRHAVEEACRAYESTE